VSRLWFLAFSLLVFLKETKSVMLCCAVMGCVCVCKHVCLYILMHACMHTCLHVHACNLSTLDQLVTFQEIW